MMDLTPPVVSSPALSHQQKQQPQREQHQHQQPPLPPQNRYPQTLQQPLQQQRHQQRHQQHITPPYGMVQDRSPPSSAGRYPPATLFDLDRGPSSLTTRQHLGRPPQVLSSKAIAEHQWEYSHQLPPVLAASHDLFSNYTVVQPQESTTEIYPAQQSPDQEWAARHAGHIPGNRSIAPVVHGNDFTYTTHELGMLGMNPHDAPSAAPPSQQALTLSTCPADDATDSLLTSSIGAYSAQSPPRFVAQGWMRPIESDLLPHAVPSASTTPTSATPSSSRARRAPRKHTTKEEANFQCTVEGCGKFFSRSYNYKSHLETHDEQREYPFPCLVSGCNKKFVRKTDLQRHHQSVHIKERNHRCDYCGRLFARKDTLRRHMEDGCSKRFDIKTLDLHSRGSSTPAVSTVAAARDDEQGGAGPVKARAVPPMTMQHTLQPEQPWRR